MWIAYGFAQQKMHVYFATGLRPCETNCDPEEHDVILRKITIAFCGMDRLWKERPACP